MKNSIKQQISKNNCLWSIFQQPGCYNFKSCQMLPYTNTYMLLILTYSNRANHPLLCLRPLHCFCWFIALGWYSVLMWWLTRQRISRALLPWSSATLTTALSWKLGNINWLLQLVTNRKVFHFQFIIFFRYHFVIIIYSFIVITIILIFVIVQLSLTT